MAKSRRVNETARFMLAVVFGAAISFVVGNVDASTQMEAKEAAINESLPPIFSAGKTVRRADMGKSLLINEVRGNWILATESGDLQQQKGWIFVPSGSVAWFEVASSGNPGGR